VKLYFDSSALVKLVTPEAESEALRSFIRSHRGDERITSALARVELVRAVCREGPLAITRARRELGRFYQLAVDTTVLDLAATVVPGTQLRSLDAIHLVSALRLGADLRAIVSYDRRMLDTAAALAMPVAAPA
jgi:predicted nucleic acid-binding protein